MKHLFIAGVFISILSHVEAQDQAGIRKAPIPEQEVMNSCDGRVFYEIFIRSFYDSNGDGIGDLNGITAKLDYLADLGIGGIWLTPFHPSPSYHKYDVMDYQSVDPQYGTLDDFKKLVAEAHRRNIYVLMDLVVNHTSSRHPWFTAALKNDSIYRDYYVWVKGDSLVEEGWYFPRDENGAEHRDEKYYGFFWKGMPDLNLQNQAVRNEIIRIGIWWLKETGVDGFRLDAAQHVFDANNPEDNVEWWAEFSQGMKSVKPDAIIIGEVWNTYPWVAEYLEAINGCFNFDLSWILLESLQKERNKGIGEKLTDIRNYYDSYSLYYIDPIFLSNHDVNRIMSDLENSTAKAKLAAAIYLTLPGTPFIYYGEEIGMRGKKPDSLIREPFLWDKAAADAGQTRWEEPYYSMEVNIDPLSVQKKDMNSMYHHYKNLVHLRKQSSPFTSREFVNVSLNNYRIFSYLRGGKEAQVLVLHNLSAEKTSISLASYAGFSKVLFPPDSRIALSGNTLTLEAFTSVVLGKP